MTELDESETQHHTPAPPQEQSANQGITFSILRQGATEAGGPYTEDQILLMLQEDQISKKDYVFFEGMRDWRRLEDVFEIHEKINHIVDDGQDKYKLGEAFREVSNVLTTGEEIYYIAIQQKAGVLTKTRQCVIITNKHLYHLTEKRVGYELEAHNWDGISNTKMHDDKKEVGTFSYLIGNERRVDVANIPMTQVKRLFELSRDLTIADWKAIRNEHYWSDKAWVPTRSWPTIEKEIAISKIWTYPSGNPQIRRNRWTQMVSNTCTGATDWQSSSLMQGKSARAYFSPMGSASGAKREY